MPSSEDEAIAAFGDGADVVVVGGGTIVVPDMTYRRLATVESADAGTGRALRDHEGRIARHDRGDDPGAGSHRRRQPPSDRREQRRGSRDPLAGNRRREPLRGRRLGGAARRPAGRAPRRRRDGSIRRRRRSHRGASRGLPRRRARADSCSSVSFDEPARRRVRRASTALTRTITRRSRSSGARAADGTIRLAATGAGPAAGSRRPRRAETRCRGRPRSTTSRRTTTHSRPPGIARRCSRCSCAASSPS